MYRSTIKSPTSSTRTAGRFSTISIKRVGIGGDCIGMRRHAASASTGSGTGIVFPQDGQRGRPWTLQSQRGHMPSASRSALLREARDQSPQWIAPRRQQQQPERKRDRVGGAFDAPASRVVVRAVDPSGESHC